LHLSRSSFHIFYKASIHALLNHFFGAEYFARGLFYLLQNYYFSMKNKKNVENSIYICGLIIQ